MGKDEKKFDFVMEIAKLKEKAKPLGI